MSWFNRIGKRKKQSETITDQEAVAFVNFDYWNYSLQKLCRLKPDINEWKKSIDENLHIKKIYFFLLIFQWTVFSLTRSIFMK